jgi:hypothetical protein
MNFTEGFKTRNGIFRRTVEEYQRVSSKEKPSLPKTKKRKHLPKRKPCLPRTNDRDERK